MTNYRLSCDRPIAKSNIENTTGLLQSKVLIHSSLSLLWILHEFKQSRLRKADVVINKGQLPNSSGFFLFFIIPFIHFFYFFTEKFQIWS